MIFRIVPDYFIHSRLIYIFSHNLPYKNNIISTLLKYHCNIIFISFYSRHFFRIENKSYIRPALFYFRKFDKQSFFFPFFHHSDNGFTVTNKSFAVLRFFISGISVQGIVKNFIFTQFPVFIAE